MSTPDYTEYQYNGETRRDYGAVWLHSDGTSLTGKLYNRAFVAREQVRDNEKAPLYRIFHPFLKDEAGKPLELGAIWEQVSKSEKSAGTVYLSAKFGPTKECQRWIKLWPRKSTSEKAPVLSVMPPNEETEEFDYAAWEAGWAAIEAREEAERPKPEKGSVPAWRKGQAAVAVGGSDADDDSDDVPF